MEQSKNKYLIVVDQAMSQKAYFDTLKHFETRQGDTVKFLLPWSLMASETGVLFDEALSLPISGGNGKEKPGSFGTVESGKRRQFLAQNINAIEPYHGKHDVDFAHAIRRELSAMAAAVPEAAKTSPESILRAVIDAALKKNEKPKKEQIKTAPKLAPVRDTSADGITTSIQRVAEVDPLIAIADTLREIAAAMHGQEAALQREKILGEVERLDKLVEKKHLALLARAGMSAKADRVALVSAIAPEEKPHRNLAPAFDSFMKNLKAINAAFKKAGINDEKIAMRFGDTGDLQAAVPTGIGMPALLQALFLVPAIRSQMQQTMSKRVHASITEFIGDFKNYLDFQTADSLHLMVVTGNSGLRNGIESQEVDQQPWIRQGKDDVTVFSSANELEGFFKPKNGKKSQTAQLAEQDGNGEERKRQRLPITQDQRDHLRALLAEAHDITSATRGLPMKAVKALTEANNEMKEKPKFTLPSQKEADWASAIANERNSQVGGNNGVSGSH